MSGKDHGCVAVDRAGQLKGFRPPAKRREQHPLNLKEVQIFIREFHVEPLELVLNLSFCLHQSLSSRCSPTLFFF